ncbi:hypothetical protein [Methylobacterium gossipiicola]|uniref:Uncharacterized protein n=1 Tax=Methylobacterium gossipiicola TaxID=582675 RepID=A0A1I2TL99_9HYPH|nr:hypothetical protein [Methylobacterium gossipiicola]SFG65593.1 hypothetical protein SAMN05192565_107187 [Methylobacterium gossipiicola]
MTDPQLACLAIAAGPFLIGLAWVLGTSAPIVFGLMLDRAENTVLRLRDRMEG